MIDCAKGWLAADHFNARARDVIERKMKAGEIPEAGQILHVLGVGPHPHEASLTGS